MRVSHDTRGPGRSAWWTVTYNKRVCQWQRKVLSIMPSQTVSYNLDDSRVLNFWY